MMTIEQDIGIIILGIIFTYAIYVWGKNKRQEWKGKKTWLIV